MGNLAGGLWRTQCYVWYGQSRWRGKKIPKGLEVTARAAYECVRNRRRTISPDTGGFHGGQGGCGCETHRKQLIDLLNEDLSREYQAIIAYVVYSQVLKGPQYMNIAAELEVHAAQELQHALLIANQIDYLGGMPTTTPKPVKTSDKATDMLQFDLDNENDTIRNYRVRVRQCEELGEYAVSEHIREISAQ